jgi:hypothetical protein
VLRLICKDSSSREAFDLGAAAIAATLAHLPSWPPERDKASRRERGFGEQIDVPSSLVDLVDAELSK